MQLQASKRLVEYKDKNITLKNSFNYTIIYIFVKDNLYWFPLYHHLKLDELEVQDVFVL